MTTDVDRISSELCLLGCHISAGEPWRGGLGVSPFWKWPLWTAAPGEAKSFTAGTQRPASAARSPLRSGPATWCLRSPASSPLARRPVVAQGSQLGLRALHRGQPRCIQGPPTLVSISIRCFCPKATTLHPLATADDSAFRTWSNFKWNYLHFFS